MVIEGGRFLRRIVVLALGEAGTATLARDRILASAPVKTCLREINSIEEFMDSRGKLSTLQSLKEKGETSHKDV